MVSQILLDALQQKRFGGKLRTIQRKKLNVEPGKSIGDDDDEFEEEEEEEEEEIEEEEDPTASEEEAKTAFDVFHTAFPSQRFLI